MYYIYMIRCSDNSIYTGISNNLIRRIEEHMNKSKKCAKYTKNHNAIKLEISWITDNKINASKLEYQIKSLTKKQKEEIIITNNLKILEEKIDIGKYKINDIDTIKLNK